MDLQVEVCYTHQMFREEFGIWLDSEKDEDIADRFERATFIESTCPGCSSDSEEVADLLQLMNLD